MITSDQQLHDYLASLDPRFFAMDTEADSLHHYAEKLCLIQVTDGVRHQLIDPFALESLQPLLDLWIKSDIWMHGADYDMMLMRKHFNLLPHQIYDTQIAARLIGAQRFGYAHLVEDYLGVTLDKASQKADWSKRPLTDDMVDYALNDVRYLKPLSERLVAELKQKERYVWFEQSCHYAMQRVIQRPLNSDKEVWRIKGSGKFSPKQLAYLKALWHWRDEQASQSDKPCFMVCSNKRLMAWVEDLISGKKPQLPHFFKASRVKSLFQVIEQVERLDERHYPQRKLITRTKKAPDFELKVNQYIVKRDALAKELKIDSSLIITRSIIESLVMAREKPQQLLMPWQLDLLDL